jgi:hypothetical protein
MKGKIMNINSHNFDANFKKILLDKSGENFIRGRYDIEGIQLKNKSGFVIQMLHAIKEIKSITYKILFWETDKTINDFFNLNFNHKTYQIVANYTGKEIPGVLFVDDEKFDKNFTKVLLNTHFNYELAVSPSLDLRVQICINNVDNFIFLLDVYDDRGFDIYHFKT